ncbi:DNA topoisomerase IB [Aestuariibius insulae]|uniref:DNA topoisomerase IB n=1 Tax=Aestuariibius insulae TaxID=2058287 RepID=UPI00345E2F94
MTPLDPDLIYYPDSEPGIRRKGRGRGFQYIAPDGTGIDDTKERERIEAIGVPPAYGDVWISPLQNGHLQATGRDERTRKQYLYHQSWAEAQAARKYDGLAHFGTMLPRLRRRIAEGLKEPKGSEDLALAAILALLDRASLRLGHPDYRDENGTYGATTLRTRHATFGDGEVDLTYAAKGGQMISKVLHGDALQSALEKTADLPGADLIGWTDDAGTARSVRSEQVNGFLHDVCGEGVSAKTFRTWNGTREAFRVALAAGDGSLTIKTMAEAAAEQLHNTATIARSSYIHPDVISLAEMDNAERKERLAGLDPGGRTGLRAGEAELLSFLSD